MKYICTARCFIPYAGRTRRFNVGDVIDAEKCPTHFEELGGKKSAPIDFSTAGEQELLEREYPLPELKRYILEKYDDKVAANLGKEKTVAKLIDHREREVGHNLDKI